MLKKYAVTAVMVIFGWALLFAADMPSLTIESPQNDATVQQTPGLGPVAIIKFKTDDFKIEQLSKEKKMDHMKMNGMAKMGHIHVTLDNASWYWVHDDNSPVVIAGLTPGQHTVKLELVTSGHMPLNPPVSQTVSFTMAGSSGMGSGGQ